MATITYQGVLGAFSYITAVKLFGEDQNYKAASTFKEAFDYVNDGEADYAVLPIENSLIGSIFENYDLLNAYEMLIIGEHYMRIEHCLLVLPCLSVLKDVKKVLSHPKALQQCTDFFRNHPWIEAVVHIDTAAAAKEVADRKDPAYAAIASAFAGEFYGLKMIERGIEDDIQNYTRFIILAKKEMILETAVEDDKCSLVMRLRHQPGTLANALELFGKYGFNLTKIESRPIRGILLSIYFMWTLVLNLEMGMLFRP